MADIVDGIHKNVWAMMNINALFRHLTVIKNRRDAIAQMRINFVAKGITITGTKLEGKANFFDGLLDKLDEIVDGVEMDWLENNTHPSVETSNLD